MRDRQLQYVTEELRKRLAEADTSVGTHGHPYAFGYLRGAVETALLALADVTRTTTPKRRRRAAS